MLRTLTGQKTMKNDSAVCAGLEGGLLDGLDRGAEKMKKSSRTS
jgi:hypothetical protein